VRLIDVMPSILDFTGLPVPEDLDGQSVITSIDTGIPEQLAVSEVEMQVGDGYEYFASVRSREWKLIGNSQGPLEIYDLQLDPGEQENLIAEPIPATAPMVEVLRLISRARESLQVERIPLDEQTQESLRALGYIE
jgi:arylsulfatase A-like enzyme